MQCFAFLNIDSKQCKFQFFLILHFINVNGVTFGGFKKSLKKKTQISLLY